MPVVISIHVNSPPPITLLIAGTRSYWQVLGTLLATREGSFQQFFISGYGWSLPQCSPLEFLVLVTFSASRLWCYQQLVYQLSLLYLR